METIKHIALITGASGNLGKAVVKKFIDEGYFVIGTFTPNSNAEHDFAEDRFEKIEVDLADETATMQAVEDILKKYKVIDVAILTVGGFTMGNIAETKTSDIAKQYKLNFETTYNVARPVFGEMIKQNNGRIFIVGSKPGLHAKNSKGMVAYGLAKSLLFRLAELMNDEAKGKNVVVNVVVPGTIDTPQNRQSIPDAHFEKWVKPENIAEIIYWHCNSKEAAVLREPVLKVYNYS